jgi:ABC-type antimicrobial peptide transport system permease subunit
MRKIRTISLILAIFFAALSVFGQTGTPATETATTNLPAVGLASTETVQVNVLNTSPVFATTSPTPAPPDCAGSIAFYDANGNVIGSATDFKVGSGQTSSAKLPYASAAASGTARIVVRAEISVTMSTVTPPTPTTGGSPVLPLFLPTCFLTSSLETYDTATGVTHTFYAGTAPQSVPVLRLGQFTAALPAR